MCSLISLEALIWIPSSVIVQECFALAILSGSLYVNSRIYLERYTRLHQKSGISVQSFDRPDIASSDFAFSGSDRKKERICKAYPYTGISICYTYTICFTSAYTELYAQGRSAGEEIMRTVSIFKSGNNRAIRLPAIWILRVSELEIVRKGTAHSASRPSTTWGSHAAPWATDFMAERARTLSATGTGLTCEQDLYARHNISFIMREQPEAPS